MFDKVRSINKWRKAQAEIEKQMEQIQVSNERAGYKVTVNANNKVLEIFEEDEENKVLRDLLNDTLKEAKKKSEKKLRGQADSLGLGDLL